MEEEFDAQVGALLSPVYPKNIPDKMGRKYCRNVEICSSARVGARSGSRD